MDLRNIVRLFDSYISSLSATTKYWSKEDIYSWFYGFIAGDGSYSCSARVFDVGVETTHLGTLFSFIAVALKISDRVRVYAYPRLDKKSRSKWKLRAYIHAPKSIHKDLCIYGIHELLRNYVKDVQTLSAFTGGLIDSDGTIVLSIKLRYRPKPRYYLEPEIAIVNKDLEMLSIIKEAWSKQGVQGNIQKHSANIFRYRISSKSEQMKILRFILKYIINFERRGKANILNSYLNSKLNLNPNELRDLVYNYNKNLYKLRELAKNIAITMYKNNVSLVLSGKDVENILIIKRHQRLW